MVKNLNISKWLKINGKNVLLVWNRWYRNLWDELILLWNIKLLLQQWKNITVACYDPEWMKNFFSQFLDVNQISFIPEIPKWIRSFFSYIFNYRLKWFFTFFNIDSIILWWWEILTEENPSAYWYRCVSIWPFLLKKLWQKFIWKKSESDLYIMWWVQKPKNKFKQQLLNFLLFFTSKCYLRDYEAVEEIWKISNCEFFMDTSFFSYEWNNVKKNDKEDERKPYIVVNINKNAENFYEDLVKDIKEYSDKWYKIFYVPIAKWNNTYYQDIQYFQKLKKSLWKNADLVILDWEYKFDNFIKILKWAEKVISSRLHLYLISSFIWCSTKVYPYQRKINKMKKVVENINYYVWV